MFGAVSTLDAPLSAEAQAFLAQIAPKIQAGLEAISQVPVSVLVWGPGIESLHPLAPVRAEVRAALREAGHLAMYSEELVDPNLPHSVRVQQFVQARAFDLIVSIPGTPGSIGEVHDFASNAVVSSKMLVFLNAEHTDGYSSKSLVALTTVHTCNVVFYPSYADTGTIVECSLEQAQRMREIKYMYGWRNPQ